MTSGAGTIHATSFISNYYEPLKFRSFNVNYSNSIDYIPSYYVAFHLSLNYGSVLHYW